MPGCRLHIIKSMCWKGQYIRTYRHRLGPTGMVLRHSEGKMRGKDKAVSCRKSTSDYSPVGYD